MRLQPAGLDRIARLSAALDGPVQAAYRLDPPPQASSGSRLATFATVLKQIGRPLGASRLGWPCGISGTGFAVPTRLLGTVGLANGHIAEDLKLGLDLALAGHPPRFCPQAEVTSALPAGAAARRAQQTRWEHGHLSLIPAYAGRFWRAPCAGAMPRLAALALDLCVLPLVTLALAEAALTGIGLAWWVWGRDGTAADRGASLALLVLAFGLAARRWGGGLLRWRDPRGPAAPRRRQGRDPRSLRAAAAVGMGADRAGRGGAVCGRGLCAGAGCPGGYPSLTEDLNPPLVIPAGAEKRSRNV